MLKNMSLRDERLGQVRTNHQGLEMKVVNYDNCHRIMVEFEDGTIVKTAWKEFDGCSTTNPNYKTYRKDTTKYERLFEEKENNQGYIMKIIQYNNANDIMVQFDNDPTHIVKSYYQHFKNGITENPFRPSIFGVGIIGTGYPTTMENGKDKVKEYSAWSGILERCYHNNRRKRNAAYDGCTVSDEFKYYPNFYNWIIKQENYDVWKNTRNYAVDKDILVKNNKVYSAETCCLVPNRINNLIKPHSVRRGECVIGVFKNGNHYVAQCWNGFLHKNTFLGNFDNEYDAFLAYKDFKEWLIKENAEVAYYNHLISKQCYDALMRYEVEITD